MTGARAGGHRARGYERASRQPVSVRREERELFFWTARQVLTLVFLTALTAYSVISMMHGELLPVTTLFR